MRNAVEIIDGPIKRIDHPLMFGVLIASDSFFAKQFSSRARSLFGGIEIVLHQTLRRTKRTKCTAEIKVLQPRGRCCHLVVFIGLQPSASVDEKRERESAHDCTWLKPGVTHNKKTGRKINSPPGLKLGL